MVSTPIFKTVTSGCSQLHMIREPKERDELKKELAVCRIQRCYRETSLWENKTVSQLRFCCQDQVLKVM